MAEYRARLLAFPAAATPHSRAALRRGAQHMCSSHPHMQFSSEPGSGMISPPGEIMTIAWLLHGAIATGDGGGNGGGDGGDGFPALFLAT